VLATSSHFQRATNKGAHVGTARNASVTPRNIFYGMAPCGIPSFRAVDTEKRLILKFMPLWYCLGLFDAGFGIRVKVLSYLACYIIQTVNSLLKITFLAPKNTVLFYKYNQFSWMDASFVIVPGEQHQVQVILPWKAPIQLQYASHRHASPRLKFPGFTLAY
jgi:hypothetical protein